MSFEGQELPSGANLDIADGEPTESNDDLFVRLQDGWVDLPKADTNTELVQPLEVEKPLEVAKSSTADPEITFAKSGLAPTSCDAMARSQVNASQAITDAKCGTPSGAVNDYTTRSGLQWDQGHRPVHQPIQVAQQGSWNNRGAHTVPVANDGFSQVTISKGDGGQQGYGGYGYGGWNPGYGQQQGDSKSINVVTIGDGSTPRVHDSKQEVVVNGTRVTDERTDVIPQEQVLYDRNGNPVVIRQEQPVIQQQQKQGWTPKEKIGMTGVILNGTRDIIGASKGNYPIDQGGWNGNSGYGNRGYGQNQNIPRWRQQQQGGRNKTINVITQGGRQPRVHDRSSEVHVDGVSVIDESTDIIPDNGGYRTPGIIPENQRRGRQNGGILPDDSWTPKEVIGWTGVVLGGARDITGVLKQGKNQGRDYRYQNQGSWNGSTQNVSKYRARQHKYDR